MFRHILSAALVMGLVLTPLTGHAQQGKPVVAVVEMRDLSNNGLGDSFSTMIATAIAATSKFRVIERTQMDKLLNEQQKANSGLVTTNKPGKTGGFEGADYLVYGTITSLSVVNKSDFGSNLMVGLLGGNSNSNCIVAFATVSVDIKITSASTGEIKHVQHIDEQQKSDPVCDGTPRIDSAVLMRGAADRVATGLVQAIYPIQVAAVQADGGLVLNYGEGTVKVGDIMTVYSKGDVIIDPATGEVLANDEIKLGFIRITEVNGRVSKAVTISTFATPVERGAIVRPASAEDIAAINGTKKKR